MGYSQFACGVWGVNLEEVSGIKDILGNISAILMACEVSEDFDYLPESFYENKDDDSDDSNLKPMYADIFSRKDLTQSQIVMKLYGERLAQKMPYVYDMLKEGATFHYVSAEASDYNDSVMFGWGIYQLPLENGTSHLHKDFLKVATHWTWVIGF